MAANNSFNIKVKFHKNKSVLVIHLCLLYVIWYVQCLIALCINAVQYV